MVDPRARIFVVCSRRRNEKRREGRPWMAYLEGGKFRVGGVILGVARDVELLLVLVVVRIDHAHGGRQGQESDQTQSDTSHAVDECLCAEWEVGEGVKKC